MAVNVTNIEGMVRAFAIRRIQEKYPNLDITENSAFDDILIKPSVALLTPVFEKMNTMEMIQNLDNAEYMSEEELDDVGEGNYFVKRKQGSRATTTLTLSFANQTGDQQIVVPGGITFQTTDGLQFQSVARVVITVEDLPSYYNSYTGYYDVPVSVEATDVGTDYNVNAETITVCSTLFNTNLISVTNLSAVTNGTNKATNVEYAEQIRNFYISRQIGTEEGYIAFILENFDEVKGVYVSGYGDEFMQRDLMTFYDSSTSTTYQKHIGGAVDLYIKGCTYIADTVDLTLYGPRILLEQEYGKILATAPANFTLENLSFPAKLPKVSKMEKVVLGGVERMVVTIGADGYTADAKNLINITYQYKDASNATQTAIKPCVIGQYDFVNVNSPMVDIVGLKTSAGIELSNPATHIQKALTGIAGTTQEKSSVTLKISSFDTLEYINGTVFTLQYTSNFTLRSIASLINDGGQRLVTSDILAKESAPTYINITMQLKLKTGATLDSSKKAKLRAVIATFLSSLAMGQDVTESDIVHHLMNDSDVNKFVEFIKLPFTVFCIQVDPTATTTATRTGTLISVPANSYPLLHSFIAEVYTGN